MYVRMIDGLFWGICIRWAWLWR